MRTAGIGLVLLLTAGTALAQAPAQDRSVREQAIQRGQQRASGAYSNLQQAQYEAKLAEQEFLNAQEAQHAAQKHAEELKLKLDGAKKALDAARQKEAQARKAYDEALDGVERARQPAPVR